MSKPAFTPAPLHAPWSLRIRSNGDGSDYTITDATGRKVAFFARPAWDPEQPGKPEVERKAKVMTAAPLLYEALVAQEEAERAQDAYRREEKAPLCGLPAEDRDAWKLRLSDLAQDAFDLTAKAKQLRAAALSTLNERSQGEG
jgi:hypothetical protein